MANFKEKVKKTSRRPLIYKALGNETFYGPEENPEDQQEQQQQ